MLLVAGCLSIFVCWCLLISFGCWLPWTPTPFKQPMGGWLIPPLRFKHSFGPMRTEVSHQQAQLLAFPAPIIAGLIILCRHHDMISWCENPSVHAENVSEINWFNIFSQDVPSIFPSFSLKFYTVLQDHQLDHQKSTIQAWSMHLRLHQLRESEQVLQDLWCRGVVGTQRHTQKHSHVVGDCWKTSWRTLLFTYYMAMDQYLWIAFLMGWTWMNIHFNPAILMWTTGVQGFDTLPYIYILLAQIWTSRKAWQRNLHDGIDVPVWWVFSI